MEGAASIGDCLIRILSSGVSGSTIPSYAISCVPKSPHKAISIAFGSNVTYCGRHHWIWHTNKLFIDI